MDFRLTVPELASNCWPATPQSLVNEMFEKTRGQLADLEGVIISSTTPDPEDEGRLWIKTDINGIPIGQFIFASGKWIWPLWGAVNRPSELMMWEGDLASIATIDGGAAEPAGIMNGPFWEIHTEFEGRSPMAAGDIPSANPAKSLANLEDYGEGAHIQTEDELAEHVHEYIYKYHVEQTVQDGSGEHGVEPGNFTTITTDTEPTGISEPMPVIHPVRGVYILRRTGRLYLTG